MRSMTGFGQASWQGDGRRIAVEVRSVNQRFLDVRINLPREYQPWEEEIKKLIQGAAERGKVDVTINRSGTGLLDFEVEINESVARKTIEGLRRLQRQLDLPGEIDVSAIIGRGEFVRVVERRREPSGERSRVQALVTQALHQFNQSRRREGEALGRDMRARVAHLQRIEKAVRKRTTHIVPDMKRRLWERLALLLGDQKISPERLAQEAAVLADRSDVTEELVRLDSHLVRMRELLRDQAAIGKPIDFLLQEIHREVNTIASKSADIEITNLTLDAKAEIEKLREQVQNIE